MHFDYYVGSSDIGDVPWVSIFCNDQNLEICYLFKSDMSGVYLTLRTLHNQAIKNIYGSSTVPHINSKSNYIREFIEPKLNNDYIFDIDLGVDEKIAIVHNADTIVAKRYNKGEIPNTFDLEKDFSEFLNLYEDISKHYTDPTFISKDEWISVLEQEGIIDDEMFLILKLFNSYDNHTDSIKNIANELINHTFKPRENYKKLFSNNGIRVQQFLHKKPLFDFDGSKLYWTMFFYGNDDEDDFKYTLKEELIKALCHFDMARSKKILFNEYLYGSGFYFDKETIENYLLSLKVKPFTILTGNSGTGKTKLSQLFSKYISDDIFASNSEKNIPSKDVEEYVMVNATTTKSSWKRIEKNREKNPGWTLSYDDFLDYLPLYQFSGEYKIELDGIEDNIVIDPVIQIYYDKNYLKFKNEFKTLYEKEEKIKEIYSEIDQRYNEKQVTDLFVNLDAVNLLINKKDKFDGDICLKKKVVASTISDSQFLIPYEIFDIVPFNKGNINCKIISNGKFADANMEIKFKLRNLSQEIKNHLDEIGVGSEYEFIIKDVHIDLDEFNPNLSMVKKFSKEQISKLNDEEIQLVDLSKNYQIVPVGANWTENRNIVGFLNIITGDYEKTPSYELILKSNTNYNNQNYLNEPYFLILDEMNLSHVERYFADFLSAIESDEKIPIYGGDDLELTPNLFVIGTVNVDETTYMFSPKVLDRANVIEFNTYPANQYILSNFDENSLYGDIEFLEDPLKGIEVRDMDIEELYNIFKDVKVNGDDFWDILSKQINEFQKILEKSHFDFGFRVINEIVRFMAVSWMYECCPSNFIVWERYFDAQIKQKMLPKLHGSEKVIGDTLKELYNACLVSAIDNPNKGDYKYYHSAKKIEELIEILENQRYVSFIN